jgi:large subunit ribosomal protein L23
MLHRCLSASRPLAFVVRRAYSTPPTVPLPTASRIASTPHAIRKRRERRGLSEDPLPSGLTPAEKEAYDNLKARGSLLQEGSDEGEPSEEKWLERLNRRRSRIRGVKSQVDEETGEVTEKIVGQRIYLPNIIFRIMRNHTPPGEPYNPYEATFRIPQSVTKLDVRSYLKAAYGVDCTYVRTDNYFSPIGRGLTSGLVVGRHNSKRTFKRAVVGLVEPFYFPEMVEDMDKEAREKREKEIDNQFRLTEFKATTRRFYGSVMKMDIGWKNRASGTKNIMKMKQERVKQEEDRVKKAVKEMLAAGSDQPLTRYPGSAPKEAD